jgi:serine phosphatase RsbU (regulator of sigma subunit)
MTLRSKLTIAFFAISVVPLSSVTLFTYLSSERALRRAAEQQANGLADELCGRMEMVTADLERRMDRAWPMPAPSQVAERNRSSQPPAPAAPAAPAGPEQIVGHVASVLADIAPVLENVEFVPSQPPRPSADPSGAAAAPAPPGPPGPPPGRRHGQRPGDPAVAASIRVAIDMSQALSEAMKKYKGGQVSAGQAEVAAWTQQLQDRIRREVARQAPVAPGVGTTGMADPPVQAPAAPARSATQPATSQAEPQTRTVTVLRGNALHTEVHQDGRPVGQINARINTDRLFRAVLSMTKRDRQEIPFAVDVDGRVHAPRSSDRATVESLQVTRDLPANGTTVRSDWVVATHRDPSGATFGIARPLGNELRDLRRVSFGNFAVGFGLIGLVFLASGPLAFGMTRNLRTLMDGVKKLSSGDMSARVEVKAHDEFGRLGTAFNQMAENLAAHQRLVVQQERLRRELELCRQIQNEMLPHQPLRLGLSEVNGVSIPAREVGGDFFNYFALPGGEIALLVGDVSGKGVGAALLMANVQATLRARLPLEPDLAALAATLDADLEANTPPEVYLTLFVGIVDTGRGVLRYVSAGHNSQFVLRAGGGVETLASTGRPLGLIAGGGYEQVTLPLADGDILFFYTDGMVEAEDERGDFLGPERLEALLAASPRGGVDAVLAHVESEVDRFRGSAELSDDATMMALRFGANKVEPPLV